ncbi:MAG: MotA/TolQ/ExbB proton channel family protein [Hyphomicrobiales bacterium]|nr:MotA/TolQ/ExbB proton channel family protein [Hyphomicrobiales bacterium]
MSHRYLLVLRFALMNLVAVSLTAAAYLQGWLNGLFAKYTLSLSALIFAVFLYGLALCGLKIWETSVALNQVNSGAPDPGSKAARYLASIQSGDGESRSIRIGMLRLQLSHGIGIVRQIANSLVFLGLIGTVIGFIIALSGVDPAAATEVNSVAPMVSTLITGMSVALYTTLLGAVLNVWLSLNHRLLATGTVNLIAALVELGETRGTA